MEKDRKNFSFFFILYSLPFIHNILHHDHSVMRFMNNDDDYKNIIILWVLENEKKKLYV